MNGFLLKNVIAGLDPAIHGPAREDGPAMDGRIKPGHDTGSVADA